MKKQQKHLKIIFIISLIAILFVGLFFGSLYEDYKTNRESRINQKHQNLIENLKSICGNLELNETAYCLRNLINRSFNYYLMSDTETMSRTFLEIYEKGGDCLDYSILYSKLIDSMYYESEIIIDLKDQHAYVKMYKYFDKESYCILDLIAEPECFIKENKSEGIFWGNNLIGSSIEIK